MKGIGNIKSKETQTASKKANLVQSEIKKEEEKIGFWGKVKNFFKSVVNGIKGLWNEMFGGEKEDEDACSFSVALLYLAACVFLFKSKF